MKIDLGQDIKRALSLYVTAATVLTLVIISVIWQWKHSTEDSYDSLRSINSQVLQTVQENQAVIKHNQLVIEELQIYTVKRRRDIENRLDDLESNHEL